MPPRAYTLSVLLLAMLASASCTAQNAGSGPSPGAGGPPPGGANAAMEAAMKACATKQGASAPTPGQPPTGLDMQAFEACMSEKGFQRPQGPPPQSRDGTAPAPPATGAGPG